MANDNQPPKSKRDTHIERLRGKYPDRAFEDDEEIFGAIGDDYDGYEKEIEQYKGREKALSDMFAADPRSAQFLTDMHQGRSPWANYIRLFGPELKDSLDDPDTIKAIEEAETDYVKRVAESKRLEEEYEKNIIATNEALDRIQKEKGLSEEQAKEAEAVLIGIVRDGVMGIFKPETIEMVLKALNYDADVASAAEEGEIAGRNAKITEQLRQAEKGDGTAPLNGKNSAPASRSLKSQSIFDIASQAV